MKKMLLSCTLLISLFIFSSCKSKNEKKSYTFLDYQDDKSEIIINGNGSIETIYYCYDFVNKSYQYSQKEIKKNQKNSL